MVVAQPSTLGVIRETTYVSAMTACAAGGIGVTLCNRMLEKYAEYYVGKQAAGPLKAAGGLIEFTGLSGIELIEAALTKSLRVTDSCLESCGKQVDSHLLRVVKGISTPDFYDSAAVVAKFLKSLNSEGTIVQLLKGLKLLGNIHKVEADADIPQTTPSHSELPSLEIVENWEYGFKCAIAACGGTVLRFLGLADVLDNEAALLSLTGVTEVVRFESSSTICRPAHYVGIDHDKKLIIVGVRGTMAVQDVVTDLVCEQQDFNSILCVEEGREVKGKAHSGFLRAAKRLAEELTKLVTDKLTENQGYGLYVTGHSLGGGVATLLTLIWAHNTFFQTRGIRCIAFGPPCSVSKEIALAPFTKKYVESVTLDDDFVSRLSLGSVTELSKLALLLSKADDQDTTSLRGIARQVFDEVEKIKLYPAGTVWHLPSYSIKCSTYFDRIKLSPNMFSVHFPTKYLGEILKLKGKVQASTECQLQ